MASKANDAFRTIGELSRELGIRAHVLRYWEEQFPMLAPLKRAGGRRYYRPEDVALVRRIDRLLHGEGYTAKGALAQLKSEAAATGNGKGDSSGDARLPAALASELRAIRDSLEAALAVD